MSAVRMRITGKVQGVSFRAYTRDLADSLQIRGLVRNESNGSVYIEGEGPAPKLDSFISGCRVGPIRAEVLTFVLEEQPEKGYVGFVIQR